MFCSRSESIVRSRITHTVLAVLLAVVLAPLTAAQSLQVEVEELIRKSPIQKALTGVSIRDTAAPRSGELVNVDGRRALIPASNMKLLSTGAALHVLGGDFQVPHTHAAR